MPLGLAALLLIVTPGTSVAQGVQYSTPGDVNTEPEASQEALIQDMNESRWRLGALRIDPSVYVNGLSYVSDVFPGSDSRDESDITARAGAGLRAYVPVGRDVIVMGWALPEYVWWAETEERRRLNNFFGGGVFASFNRLDFEVALARKEEERIPNAELLQEVPLRNDTAHAKLDVEVFDGIWALAYLQEEEVRYLVDDLADLGADRFEQLDRDQTVTRGGLRFRLGNIWTATAGFEHVEVDFLAESRPLSHSGSSPFLKLVRKRGDSEIRLELVQRQVDPEPGSIFVPFDETLGFATVSFKPRGRLTARLYVSRNLVFSVSNEYVYFLDERVGAGLSWEIGRRSTLQFFAETGDQDYSRIDPLAPLRVDDFSGFGAQLEIDLRSNTTVAIGVVQTTVDSVVPGQQQDVTRLTTSLRIGGGRWP